jgi:hypothetical protein
MQRLALHYAAHQIGRWDRLLHRRKFGRPSRIHGEHYGFGSNDPKMIEEILEGYRRYAGVGQHMSRIYHLTLTKIFGCVVQKNPNGMRVFVHPSGHPFHRWASLYIGLHKYFRLNSGKSINMVIPEFATDLRILKAGLQRA